MQPTRTFQDMKTDLLGLMEAHWNKHQSPTISAIFQITIERFAADVNYDPVQMEAAIQEFKSPAVSTREAEAAHERHRQAVRDSVTKGTTPDYSEVNP